MPVERRRRSVRRGVEHDVVGDLAALVLQRSESVAKRDADAMQCVGAGVVKVGIVCPRDHEHLVGRACPVRGVEHSVVGRIDDPVSGSLLIGTRGTEQTAARESREASLLVDEFSRDEWNAEELTVRVLDRGAGVGSGVDDRLGVAKSRCVLMDLDPVSKACSHPTIAHCSSEKVDQAP